tara:strand:+ start:318 stop:632 length:315 start_codon:yes stop_codon:yes gene_type:complete
MNHSVLEPYQSNIFYHHSHLLLYNLLVFGGLKINKKSPGKDWNIITTQAYMILFPRLNWKIVKKIIFLFQKLHEMWYKFYKLNENERILLTIVKFSFIAKIRNQ